MATVRLTTAQALVRFLANQYVDRDIDDVMRRTQHRPLPRHLIAPRSALVFGIGLSVISFVWFALIVNLLAAVLTASAVAFYVFVYTLWLKRSTPQNIVIGGAAGAVPALVGWSAVTGGLELAALAMFGIIFYWTPPHFWALSLRYEREYETAGIPMMPVVYGRQETAKHILLYSFILLAMCLILFSVGQMGLIYLASACVLNGGLIALSVRLYRAPTSKGAWRLFRYSIYYLGLLFAAMAIDQLVVL
jgi:heme o synthase